jgi:hypothetical protein
VLADTPNGYWKLDEASGNLADSSGNSLTLTANGSPTYGGTGPGTGNKCLTFVSTSSQYLTASDPGSSPADLGNVFTLECWYKRSAVQNQYQYLFSKGVNTYALRIENDNKFHLDNQDNISVGSSTTTLTDTASWHHMVCVRSGSATNQTFFYIDGIDVTGAISSTTLTDGNNTFTVGAKSDDTFTLDGSLSNCAIYPTALTPARVDAHYAAMFAPSTDTMLVMGMLGTGRV